MSKNYFHLTLGPVQGFVAQARRTRDYWAGSFLLSWLSGVAIRSVQNQKAKVNFPRPDENFLEAISPMGKQEVTSWPKQGGIPNRFKTYGVLVEVSNSFDPELVIADIRSAWAQLADLVWERDVLPFLSNHREYDRTTIENIWQRQINGIWDISWVLTEDEQQTNLLDRRKNWRTHYLPEEEGSKCMMMGSWQELSGTVQSGRDNHRFWSDFREHMCVSVENGKDVVQAVDLNEGEQLSALGLVKRRFAHHFEHFSATLPSGISARGWPFKENQNDLNSPLHVPSLPYLAAVPWLKQVIESAKQDNDIYQDLNSVASAAKTAFGNTSANVRIAELSCEEHPITMADGASFYPDMLISDSNYRKGRATERAFKRELSYSFKSFCRNHEIEPPSPFYALLIMDGDSLGVQMGDPNKQKGISYALNQFTKDVQTIVSENNGFLIYAGGDDVLALFPMEYALPTAIKIREAYDAQFEGNKDNEAVSTISAGIQYAHIKSPLMKIISDAHHLLDDVAKDQSGRDSIAIKVHKPGGVHCLWHMPWEIYLNDNALVELVEQITKLGKARVTNSWLAKVHELMIRLTDENHELKIDQNGLRLLIKQAYLHSAATTTLPDEVDKIVDLLLKASAFVTRKAEVVEEKGQRARFSVSYLPEQGETSHYQQDTIKLVRFLSTKGVQE